MSDMRDRLVAQMLADGYRDDVESYADEYIAAFTAGGESALRAWLMDEYQPDEINDAVRRYAALLEASETPTTGSQSLAGVWAGQLPTRTPREPLRASEWPCEQRVAHEPHGHCPGVKAHPNTMIGK